MYIMSCYNYIFDMTYAIVLKIKQELYIASESASTKENF